MLAASLAGSRGPARAEEPFAQPDYRQFSAEQGPVNLEVWSWVSGLDQVARQFEQAYPDIKVRVVNLGGGSTQYQKLQIAIKAGSGGPDVAQIEYDYLPTFVATDGLADLAKLGLDRAKPHFVSWTWSQVSPDGKAVYGVPQDSGPLGLVYNQKIFERYGLQVPATWDEFAGQAEKLARASNGQVRFSNFPATYAPWFIGLAWASGAELFRARGEGWTQSLNSPACEKVLAYWNELIKKQYVSTIPDFTAEFYNAVGSGQIAALVEAAWGPGVLASSVKERTAGEWRVAPLPQWSKDQPFRNGNWGGSCDTVLKQSRHPRAAALFCLWLNTAQAPILTNWNNYGLFPAAVAGLASPELNQPDKNPGKFCGGQNVAAAYAQASRAVNLDFAWAPWFAFVNDNFNKQINAMIVGALTPKQALEAWQNESLKHAQADGYDVKPR